MATRVPTGKVRFSYMNVFQPQADVEGGQEKYSVTLLIPKSDTKTLKKIKAAMEEARELFEQKNPNKKLPKTLKHTMHDGDGERPSGGDFGEECADHMVITVRTNRKPVLVDKNKEPITDEDELYSGCYGRAIITFFVYSLAGNVGISASLNGIMKLQDGAPLAGSAVSSSAWDEDWEDDWDDDDDIEDVLG